MGKIIKHKRIPENQSNRDNITRDSIRKSLEPHFNYKFKNKDDNKMDILIALIEQEQSNRQFAILAHQIYISDYFIKSDFKHFSDWHKTFCKIVGREPKSYKPNKLQLKPQEEKKYFFLHNMPNNSYNH